MAQQAVCPTIKLNVRSSRLVRLVLIYGPLIHCYVRSILASCSDGLQPNSDGLHLDPVLVEMPGATSSFLLLDAKLRLVVWPGATRASCY